MFMILQDRFLWQKYNLKTCLYKWVESCIFDVSNILNNPLEASLWLCILNVCLVKKPTKDCKRPCRKLWEIRIKAANNPLWFAFRELATHSSAGTEACRITENGYTPLTTFFTKLVKLRLNKMNVDVKRLGKLVDSSNLAIIRYIFQVPENSSEEKKTSLVNLSQDETI